MWSHSALLSNGFLMRVREGERSRQRSSFEKQGEISILLLRALTFCVCVRARMSVCVHTLALFDRPLAPFRALSELHVPLRGKRK